MYLYSVRSSAKSAQKKPTATYEGDEELSQEDGSRLEVLKHHGVIYT